MSEIESINQNADIRCLKCKKLLARGMPGGHVEVKCLRCGMLNVVFKQVTDQLVIIDQKGLILYINEALAKQTGYSDEEAIGKKPSGLWGGEMPKEFYKKMWETIKDGKKSFQADLVNKKKSGELYKIKLVVSPILDGKGEVVFYIGTETVYYET